MYSLWKHFSKLNTQNYIQKKWTFHHILTYRMVDSAQTIFAHIRWTFHITLHQPFMVTKNAIFRDLAPCGSWYNECLGGTCHIWNVTSNKTHIAPHPRRQHYSQSLPLKPKSFMVTDLLCLSSMHRVERQAEPNLSQQWFKYFAAISCFSLEEAIANILFTFNYHLQS
jgi:hypothetical protein